MSNQKVYYSIYTTQEKIWIRADVCETLDGCLVFSDYDEDAKTKITIAAFQKGYWLYCYEADAETGESIPEAIPFWKRHAKSADGSPNHTPQQDFRKRHSS